MLDRDALDRWITQEPRSWEPEDEEPDLPDIGTCSHCGSYGHYGRRCMNKSCPEGKYL